MAIQNISKDPLRSGGETSEFRLTARITHILTALNGLIVALIGVGLLTQEEGGILQEMLDSLAALLMLTMSLTVVPSGVYAGLRTWLKRTAVSNGAKR